MAKREIKFSLVYRDMWQSSGKYVPRVDQLVEVAPAIIDMGCFDRVETNGGAFEQVNLLFGENPNKAVRAWTAPFHKAGIQTHMLERGLNALRMNPVPLDVRELMFKVKKKQGTDIARSFCGLNDHRNLKGSVIGAKKGGMISQVALSITYSPVHTVAYYMDIVDKVVEYGADEICLKDMAGIGRPNFLAELVTDIKKKYPHIKVQYHGHTGPGFSPASMLEVARAGADYLDVAVEPLSWGKVHPDVITIREMLRCDGFQVKDLNMDAYMEVRRLTQKFMDDFLGYWINPSNAKMTRRHDGFHDGRPQGLPGRHQRRPARAWPSRDEPGHPYGQALRGSGVCMAPPGIPAAGYSVQPVCVEHGSHEPVQHAQRQTPLDHHRQGHLGHDPRKHGQTAR